MWYPASQFPKDTSRIIREYMRIFIQVIRWIWIYWNVSEYDKTTKNSNLRDVFAWAFDVMLMSYLISPNGSIAPRVWYRILVGPFPSRSRLAYKRSMNRYGMGGRVVYWLIYSQENYGWYLILFYNTIMLNAILIIDWSSYSTEYVFLEYSSFFLWYCSWTKSAAK